MDDKGPQRRKPFKGKAMKPPLTIMPAGPVERKYVDLNQVTQAVTGIAAGVTGQWTTLAAANLCNGLAQGAAGNNRLGRKILMKSVYLRVVHYNNNANTSTGPLRVLVIYDKQCNGAFPPVATTAATAPMLFNEITSPNNLSCAERYVTIFDKLMPPVSGTSQPGGPTAVTKKWFRKINLETIYNTGNAGTIADITSGAVYITFCSAGFPAAGTTVDYTVRTRFVDE